MTDDAQGARTRNAVRRLPTACAAAVAAIALLVLVGWAFDLELLKSHTLKTPMNPATAVAFLLASTSLWLSRAESGVAHARRWAVACAVVVAVLALSRLGGYWLGWDAGLDRILFRSKLHGNVMAPNTAALFALVALALLTLDARGRLRTVPSASVLIAGSSALLCLTGYLYNESALIGVRGHIPMAQNTAVGFALLVVGLLCARPHREPIATLTSDTLGGVVARRLLPAAFVVPLLLGWLRLRGEEMGLYGRLLGLALFVLAVIAVFNLLIWWCARVLQRTDLAHRRTENALRGSEQRYRSILEQAAEGIYLVDLETRVVVDSNNAFDGLLGYPHNDTLGRSVHEFIDDTPEHVDARLAALAASDVPLRGERVYRRRDGSDVEVESSACVISYGRRPVACTVVRDITARKKAERELHEKNRQLQAAYRAEQEAREQLQRAQSQLVQNEKLAGLGQTVAGVAHEINNPLSFVSNNVAVLERDIRAICELLSMYQRADPLVSAGDATLAAEIREQAERIDLAYTIPNIADVLGRSREGLRRIQQIVKDLRDFARLDEGDPHEVDLNAGVVSTVNIVQGRGKTRRVTVATELGELPRITCHPAKLNQVVMNLVANAIDASPDGGHVAVRTRQEGDALLIEVIDNGPGVPEAIRGRIFDPFFTTKPQGEGTGLGLSISYGIVRDHGGTLNVGDAPGGGAIFTVRLPASGVPAKA